MQENPIDKIFREKLNLPYKTYNQEHWEQAKVHLNKFRETRKDRRQLLTMLLLLVSILLASLVYQHFHRKPSTPDIKEKMQDTPMATLDPFSEDRAISETDETYAQSETGKKEIFEPERPGVGEPDWGILAAGVQEQNKAPGSDDESLMVHKLENLDKIGPFDPLVMSHVSGIESQTRRMDHLKKLQVTEIQPIRDLAYNLSVDLEVPGTPLSTSFSEKINIGWTGTLMINPAIDGGSEVQGIQLGGVVEYPMSRQWVIGSRPHFHLTVNESGFSKFDEQISFGFGSETTTYGLRAKSLQFVSLPVYVGWKSSKHQIEMGGGVDILLAARGQLQEIDVHTSQIRPLLELRSGWIETKEMQALSLNLFAGYKLKLSDKLFSGFSVFYNPSQIYPGFPNNLPQNYQRKWHFGLQTNYYFK